MSNKKDRSLEKRIRKLEIEKHNLKKENQRLVTEKVNIRNSLTEDLNALFDEVSFLQNYLSLAQWESDTFLHVTQTSSVLNEHLSHQQRHYL